MQHLNLADLKAADGTILERTPLGSGKMMVTEGQLSFLKYLSIEIPYLSWVHTENRNAHLIKLFKMYQTYFVYFLVCVQTRS